MTKKPFVILISILACRSRLFRIQIQFFPSEVEKNHKADSHFPFSLEQLKLVAKEVSKSEITS